MSNFVTILVGYNKLYEAYKNSELCNEIADTEYELKEIQRSNEEFESAMRIIDSGVDVKVPWAFNGAVAIRPVYRDPLILDLDGDGIETISMSLTNPVLFDHDGDGLKNGTGWIKPDDGFLVIDSQTIEIHSYAALPACAVHSRQALQSSALRRTQKVRLTSRALRALPLNGFEWSEKKIFIRIS